MDKPPILNPSFILILAIVFFIISSAFWLVLAYATEKRARITLFNDVLPPLWPMRNSFIGTIRTEVKKWFKRYGVFKVNTTYLVLYCLLGLRFPSLLFLAAAVLFVIQFFSNIRKGIIVPINGYLSRKYGGFKEQLIRFETLIYSSNLMFAVIGFMASAKFALFVERSLVEISLYQTVMIAIKEKSTRAFFDLSLDDSYMIENNFFADDLLEFWMAVAVSGMLILAVSILLDNTYNRLTAFLREQRKDFMKRWIREEKVNLTLYYSKNNKSLIDDPEFSKKMEGVAWAVEKGITPIMLCPGPDDMSNHDALSYYVCVIGKDKELLSSVEKYMHHLNSNPDGLTHNSQFHFKVGDFIDVGQTLVTYGRLCSIRSPLSGLVVGPKINEALGYNNHLIRIRPFMGPKIPSEIASIAFDEVIEILDSVVSDKPSPKRSVQNTLGLRPSLKHLEKEGITKDDIATTIRQLKDLKLRKNAIPITENKARYRKEPDWKLYREGDVYFDCIYNFMSPDVALPSFFKDSIKEEYGIQRNELFVCVLKDGHTISEGEVLLEIPEMKGMHIVSPLKGVFNSYDSKGGINIQPSVSYIIDEWTYKNAYKKLIEKINSTLWKLNKKDQDLEDEYKSTENKKAITELVKAKKDLLRQEPHRVFPSY